MGGWVGLLSGDATGPPRPPPSRLPVTGLRPFSSRQQAARTRTGRTPAELATEEACKTYLDQLSPPPASRNNAAAAAAGPALVASTTATPVSVDAAAAGAHTAAVAHSPPPHSSRLQPSAAYAADAADAADAAADAIATAAAALADGPDGPTSQDTHPEMRRRLVPGPAPAAAMRALFATPDAPVHVAPPIGLRTESDLPPTGVSLATVPLLSNADGGGDRGATSRLGLDVFWCCCRKDQAAPLAEVSEYVPPDAPQEIFR